MKFESAETQKLSTVKEVILSQVSELNEGLQKKRTEVLESRKEMWREARIAIRDFDDVADLYLFAEEVSRNEISYEATSKQLLKLKKLLNEPYFARIDFTEDGDPEGELEEIYIGRYSLFDEDSQSYHVYDWRAPISSLYYDYGIGQASFAVPATGATISGLVSLKRQYQIEKGEILYLFDNDIAIDDKILRQELSKTADAHIKTIVNTIQAEQNKAIRSQEKTVLVYGPAGSGKTSVGLHRLAYLLYRDRGRLSSAKIRIFSPSPIFASYIAGIIPELGEEDVENLDFTTLLEEKARDRRPFYGMYQQIEHLMSYGEDDARMQWIKHIYSPAFLDSLEKFIANHTTTFEDIRFNNDVLVSRKRLEELYQDRTAASTLAGKTERVISYVERVYSEYFKANRAAITTLFNDIHDDDFSDHEIRIKYDEEKNIVVRDLKNRLSPRSQKICDKFLRKWCSHEVSGLARCEVEFLRHPAHTRHPVLDAGSPKIFYESALLLFYIDILTGAVPQDKTVKHILLDEAQDLSHLHHRILAKLYPTSHFTVLADANQALYKGINLNNIDELKQLYQGQSIKLSKSYRSTFEINNFAAQYLSSKNPGASFTRHGEEPQIIQTQNFSATVMEILGNLSDSYNTVGILLPTAAQAQEFHNNLEKLYPKGNTLRPLQLIATEDNDFAMGVMVMAVPFAKGLEFDVVICPDYIGPGAKGELFDRIMYLICTRALHKLYLLEEI